MRALANYNFEPDTIQVKGLFGLCGGNLYSS